jgi:hypothetical protein
VRDVARGQQSIAWLENNNLLSDSGLKFSSKNEVHFVLPRVCMTRHRHPGSETHLQQAIGFSCIFARQTYRTDADIKVVAFGSRLMSD